MGVPAGKQDEHRVNYRWQTVPPHREETGLVMTGVLYAIARFCARQRFLVVAVWLVAAIDRKSVV